MTRAVQYRLLYLFAVIALGAASCVLLQRLKWSPVAMIVTGGILLLPGRIWGYFRRDFSRGQRLIAAGELDRAEASYTAFLERLRTQPWFKHYFGRCWGFYTWDMEAMTLNELGRIAAARARLPEAAEFFTAASAVDPGYGVPYANLALVRAAEGDEAEAERLVSRARALGYKFFTREQVLELGRAAREAAVG